MIELPILSGYCTIQIEYKISGCNRYPDSLVWGICGNVLVDEINFWRLSQHRWLKLSVSSSQYYVVRHEQQGGKRVNIYMGREILRLPHGVGHGSGIADHKNHDIREYTGENLRVATPAQSQMNIRKYGYCQRFKGIHENGDKYVAQVKVDNVGINFTSVLTDVEAALMYNYAAYLIHKEFVELNVIPDDEMPMWERQWEIYEMVLTKLWEYGIISWTEREMLMQQKLAA